MRAQEITLALGGKWFGSYGLAFCPAHKNDRTPALSLKDGEGERLLAHCHAGCNFRDVAAAIRAIGLDFRNGPLNRQTGHTDLQSKKRGTERAKTTWLKTKQVKGTLGERYLRRRSINLPLPPDLRFHPNGWHPACKRFPALVGKISMIDSDDLVAVHRTYLVEPGEKAPTAPQKAMLGPAAGGAVAVLRGPGPIVVAEGIETALSLAEGLEEHQPLVLAALSTSGVSGLWLPDRRRDLIIAPDGDGPGVNAARTLALRASKLNWSVRLLPPPGGGLDWNDVAQGGKGLEYAS